MTAEFSLKNLHITPEGRLSRLARFYIYGLHGFAMEICFTALWELVANGNPHLHGVTSIYAFFIYGMSCVVIEELYRVLAPSTSLIVRGLIYMLWNYIWEFRKFYVLNFYQPPLHMPSIDDTLWALTRSPTEKNIIMFVVILFLFLTDFFFGWYKTRFQAHQPCSGPHGGGCTGFVLKLFNACPWDYEPYFQGHFMGLITLEYAPLWYACGVFAELIVIDFTNRLRWVQLPNEKRN